MKADLNNAVYCYGTRDMVRVGMYRSSPEKLEEVLPELEEGMIVQQFPLGPNGEALQGEGVDPVASAVFYEGRLVNLPMGINSRLAMLIDFDMKNRPELSEVEITLEDVIDDMEREAAKEAAAAEPEEIGMSM